MLETLKEEVYTANMLLPKYGLVIFTWGNVSAIDRKSGLVVIKPSGMEYNIMKPSDMVVVNMDGKVIEGNLQPSSDLFTHLCLYKKFHEIGSIVHTHSQWATIFAQAGSSIEPLGTTHSDYFHGAIPCTRAMTAEEISHNYEYNTGKVIVETFENINSMDIPSVLVRNHGPFSWGKSALEAVHNAVVMEEVAKMNYHVQLLVPNIESISQDLVDKHFYRKHGPNAYYGQNKE